MLYPVRLITILWILFTAAGCSPVPESDYYESEGIVSVSAVNGDFDGNWNKAEHPLSRPLQLNTSGLSTINFQFYIQSSGRYTLWILSAMPGNSFSNDNIIVSVFDDDDFLQFQGSVAPDSSEYLTWSRLQDKSVFVEFEQPGFYEVVFEFNNQSGFLFEKLHLTKNNANPPSRYGLPETTKPDIDPVLMKRQQPVMLPPAWAFGLMVWEENHQEEVIHSIIAADIPVDAVLSGTEDSQSQMQLPSAWRDQKHIFSANVVENSGKEFIQDELVNSEIRPFLLSGMQNVNEPYFKKLPAKWANITIKDSSEQAISEALKQRIEMISNPRFASSEAPFLSTGLDHLITKSYNGSFSDEILMRWIQFSALTGMMHLYVPANSVSEPFSANVTQEIRKMTQLRSRLFPYLYSLAHLVRANADNPVRGDGVHEAQFQLGEAFLVAPVFREEDDSRAVWFPEGTWYNYWSGERFNGGQTWLVDASVNEIPLFVKAGSIIPYRSRAGQVMAGSNSELTIEIYAGGVGTFRLYEDDGVTNRYRNGEIATTGFRYFETDEYATFTIGRTVGEYDGKLEKRSLELQFLHAPEPVSVLANSNTLQQGNDIGEWSYNGGNQTITIRWEQATDMKTDFEIRFN